jgi:hypothetical protein
VCNGHAELCERKYGNTTFLASHDSFAFSGNPLAREHLRFGSFLRSRGVHLFGSGEKPGGRGRRSIDTWCADAAGSISYVRFVMSLMVFVLKYRK